MAPAHRHTWNVWRWQRRDSAGMWPRWVFVGRIKAVDPDAALDELDVGRGRFLVMHADGDRLDTYARGGVLDKWDIQVIRRWW